MFAMILDKDPSRLQDLPEGLFTWVQIAGGFASAAVVLWLLLGYPKMHPRDRADIPRGIYWVYFISVVLCATLYTLAALTYLIAPDSELSEMTTVGEPEP